MKNVFVVDEVFNYVERCQLQFVFLLSLKSISFQTNGLSKGTNAACFRLHVLIHKQEDDTSLEKLCIVIYHLNES